MKVIAQVLFTFFLLYSSLWAEYDEFRYPSKPIKPYIEFGFPKGGKNPSCFEQKKGPPGVAIRFGLRFFANGS